MLVWISSAGKASMVQQRKQWVDARETAALTIAFSTLSYLVFLTPALLDPHRFPLIAYIANGVSVAPHLVLFPALYAVMRVVSTWPRGRRVVVTVAVVVLFSWVHAVLDIRLLEAFFVAFAPGLRPPANLSINLIIFVWLYSFFAAVVGLMNSNAAMRERERQLAEAREAAQAAQLAALRFQLNPHFLFNTLNAISSLIISRRNDEAERMMEKLSDFLRATLGADPHRVVTLAEELDTVMAYLDIEKVRFGDRLAVAIDCPSGLGVAMVPSFLIQPIIENAVKYAVAPSRMPVTVSIVAREAADGRDLELTIADDAAAPHGAAPSGVGVGLTNVRSRLQVLYGVRGELVAAPRAKGFACVVTLPLQRPDQKAVTG